VKNKQFCLSLYFFVCTQVAAFLQQPTRINSPGGYLPNLTEKARAGAFPHGPMLMALIRANLRKPGEKRCAQFSVRGKWGQDRTVKSMEFRDEPCFITHTKS
jgi:hypothetical protein